jgi:hypothetical protein
MLLPPPPPGFVRLVCVSDTHGFHDRIHHIPAGDVFIHAGDAALDGFRAKPERNRATYQQFNSWVGTLPHATKLFVPGNHDTFLDPACGGIDATEMRTLLGAMRVLVNESVVAHGLRIGGAPLSYGRSPNRAFQSRETQFRAAEDAFAALMLREALPTTDRHSGAGGVSPTAVPSGGTDARRAVQVVASTTVSGISHEGATLGDPPTTTMRHQLAPQEPPYDVLITHHPVADSELCRPRAPNAILTSVLGLGRGPVAARVHVGGHFHSAFGVCVRQLEPRAVRASGGAVTHVVTACACMVDEKYTARRLPIVIDVEPMATLAMALRIPISAAPAVCP